MTDGHRLRSSELDLALLRCLNPKGLMLLSWTLCCVHVLHLPYVCPRIIEPSRLEKTTKMMASNHQPHGAHQTRKNSAPRCASSAPQRTGQRCHPVPWERQQVKPSSAALVHSSLHADQEPAREVTSALWHVKPLILWCDSPGRFPRGYVFAVVPGSFAN